MVQGMIWTEPDSAPLIAVVESARPASDVKDFPGAVGVSRHQKDSAGSPRREHELRGPRSSPP